MRYNLGHAEVQAEGFADRTAGSIQASGKSFKALIDNVYSRKIEAIIRELSTNAFDGQKLNSFVGPFAIHLPSTLDPVFWVRDFGVGMSHEYMMTRYPVLFDSTKDGQNSADADIDPNKQVGCLGIGSKSFFSYTDACTVTIWQDGVMRVYAVYMGGDGVIQVAHAGAVPSDEPSGVKVEFAVRTKDFKQFRDGAIRVFKGFPIKPDGLPSDVAAAVSVEPQMIGDGWKSFGKDYLPGGGFYARQGCVLYPIDLEQVDAKATEDDDGKVTLSSDFQRYANNDNTIVLDFPIGSIGFDLGRERLSYDDATVEALRKRWGEFRSDLHTRFRRSFKSLTSSYSRMQEALTGAVKSFGALFAMTDEAIAANELYERLWAEFPKSNGADNRYTGLFDYVLKKPEQPDETPKASMHRKATHAPKQPAILNACFVYLDEKRKMNERLRITRYLFEKGYDAAFIIRKGKLSLRRWRMLGKLPITRMSAIPHLPKEAKEKIAAQYYGGGGAFHRFKVYDDKGYLKTPTSNDIDWDNRVWLLMNRGNIDHSVNGYSDITTIESANMHQMLRMHSGKGIAFINTRRNESLAKYADYPMAYEHIEGLVDQMDDLAIKRMVAVLNHIRFDASRYYKIVQSWRRHAAPSRDPIMCLRRFRRRYVAVPSAVRRVYETFVNMAGVGGSHTRNTYRKMLTRIIERARGMGLEVLPPMALYGYGPEKQEAVPDHVLLPKRWEKIANIAARPDQHHDLFFHLLKDSVPVC